MGTTGKRTVARNSYNCMRKLMFGTAPSIATEWAYFTSWLNFAFETPAPHGCAWK